MVRFFLVLVLTLILVRVAKQPAYRLGWVDMPTTRKHHPKPIPFVGGLILWIVSALGLLACYEGKDVGLLLACMSSVTLLGFLDDLRHVPAITRLVWQIVTVLVLSMLDPTIRLLTLGNLLGTGDLEVGGFTWLLTPVAVSGMINAFNMVDGLDGLAAGLALVAIGFLWLIGLQGGVPVAGMLDWMAWVAAALIGFLCFNLRYPGHSRASIFLGDSGSTLLGFILTWLMLRLSQSETTALDPVTALWLVALPLVDTVTIMIRRCRMGLSPFAADRQHFHYLLLRRGLSDGQAVFLLLGASVILGGTGLLLEWLGVPRHYRFYSFLAFFVAFYWTTTGMLPPKGVVKPDGDRRVQPTGEVIPPPIKEVQDAPVR